MWTFCPGLWRCSDVDFASACPIGRGLVIEACHEVEQVETDLVVHSLHLGDEFEDALGSLPVTIGVMLETICERVVVRL